MLKKLPILLFPMLPIVAYYAIDSHPLFPKNLVKFVIQHTIHPSEYTVLVQFTGPSVQLYNKLPGM